MSLQLPATYDEFVEHVFAKDRDEIGGLSFVIVFARQSTAAGECAFGAAGECGCCGQSVLNVEPFINMLAICPSRIKLSPRLAIIRLRKDWMLGKLGRALMVIS